MMATLPVCGMEDLHITVRVHGFTGSFVPWLLPWTFHGPSVDIREALGERFLVVL